MTMPEADPFTPSSPTPHSWDKEHEIFEDIRLEGANFHCEGAYKDGDKCQHYQFTGQCGLVRAYLPKFCVFSRANQNLQAVN